MKDEPAPAVAVVVLEGRICGDVAGGVGDRDVVCGATVLSTEIFKLVILFACKRFHAEDRVMEHLPEVIDAVADPRFNFSIPP